MFEIQDKYVDNLGRILTIDAIMGNSYSVNLEGEIKNFISGDSLKNYLTNNGFDKINLTPADHMQEFEQETKHLINVTDNTMKTESFLKKLDRILESGNSYSKLKKTLNIKEGLTVSNVQLLFYGILPGDPESALKNTSNFKSLKKIARYYPDKAYLFAITDNARKLVRFFVVADGDICVFKILSPANSRVLKHKLKSFLTLNLVEDNLLKVRTNVISGMHFRFRSAETSEGDSKLFFTLKTEDLSLKDASLNALLTRLRSKGQMGSEEVYESRRNEGLEDGIESYNDDEEDNDEDTMDIDDLSMEVEKRLGRNKRRVSEDDEDDDSETDADMEDEIDTSDDFGDMEDEDGDEEEISADDIEEYDENDYEDESCKTESKLRSSLRKYFKVNENEIKRYLKRKKLPQLYEEVASDYPEYKRSVVLKEFKKLISSRINESLSLSFDKPIKNIHSSTDDTGKSIIEIEFDETANMEVPPVEDDDSMMTEPPVEDSAEETSSTEEETPEASAEETPTEEPKTEESYKRRVSKFLSQKI